MVTAEEVGTDASMLSDIAEGVVINASILVAVMSFRVVTDIVMSGMVVVVITVSDTLMVSEASANRIVLVGVTGVVV